MVAGFGRWLRGLRVRDQCRAGRDLDAPGSVSGRAHVSGSGSSLASLPGRCPCHGYRLFPAGGSGEGEGEGAGLGMGEGRPRPVCVGRLYLFFTFQMLRHPRTLL